MLLMVSKEVKGMERQEMGKERRKRRRMRLRRGRQGTG